MLAAEGECCVWGRVVVTWPACAHAPPAAWADPAAGDGEEQRNLDYFLKHGVEEQPAWLTYRIVVASGPGVLVRGTLRPPRRRCRLTVTAPRWL